MDTKIVYHVDRKGLLSKFSKGETIQVCPLDNPFYSSFLTGNKVSFHGNLYLNQGGIRCNDPYIRSNAVWEVFAELVRLKAFPQYESRYNALFGFEKPDDLKQFILGYGDIAPRDWNIYALEVSDYVQKDMSQFDVHSERVKVIEGDPNTYYDNLLIKHCYDYWKGNNTKDPQIETLIYGQAIMREILELREFIK